LTTLRQILLPGLTAAPHPLYPGAVALLLKHGEVVENAVVGDAVRYGPGARELPRGSRIPMRPDTVFDVASLTKLFTATVAMALVDEGSLDLDEPARAHLPELPHDEITLRHMLTHVSGLPALRRLWEVPAGDERVAAVLASRPTQPPGSRFEYSCIGYIVGGLLLERVSGVTLPDLVGEYVTTPLGLSDTRYTPPADVVERTAATENQPYVGRGVVRGSVHDENSWSLGGTAGNAGLFSTAADLARFGEMILGGGEIDGRRILSAAAVRLMTTQQLPAGIDPGFAHGIGFRIGDASFMGRLASHGAVGHTGFTGTSLIIDTSTASVVVLLTNRVHPSRDWSDIAPVRRAVADLAA
jgi:CubicO group peptidase (beta-lactamase class C family)